MQYAIVSIEDRRFYLHHGIDLYGVARAMWDDVRTRRLDQGGATLTEQLVENTLPIHGNIVVRGFSILALAWDTERRYSKARILELYLNAVYYGRGAYGIGAAAQVYFHRQPRALDVAQAAFLAALPQSPSVYGNHPFAAPMQGRWRTTIRYMEEQGYITAQRERQALREAETLPVGR
jgi:penicillin-binding protein 1A